MINRDYRTEERTITDKFCTDVHLICDCCGKEVENKSYYWRVCTGHNDWGNDSVDSIESYDLCSDECFKKTIDEFLGEGYDTPYIDAETMRYFKSTYMR